MASKDLSRLREGAVSCLMWVLWTKLVSLGRAGGSTLNCSAVYPAPSTVNRSTLVCSASWRRIPPWAGFWIVLVALIQGKALEILHAKNCVSHHSGQINQTRCFLLRVCKVLCMAWWINASTFQACLPLVQLQAFIFIVHWKGKNRRRSLRLYCVSN